MVKFRVSPKMNKIEMKEWIETAYDTPVKKVNTANYEGKIVRRSGGKGTQFECEMFERAIVNDEQTCRSILHLSETCKNARSFEGQGNRVGSSSSSSSSSRSFVSYDP